MGLTGFDESGRRHGSKGVPLVAVMAGRQGGNNSKNAFARKRIIEHRTVTGFEEVERQCG